MVAPVAISLPRGDIDSIDAIVMLQHREAALRMRRVNRHRADQSRGGETRTSGRRHLIVPSLTLHPLALPFAKGYSERVFQNSQSIAGSANEFGDARLPQSHCRLSLLASRKINARRSSPA